MRWPYKHFFKSVSMYTVWNADRLLSPSLPFWCFPSGKFDNVFGKIFSWDVFTHHLLSVVIWLLWAQIDFWTLEWHDSMWKDRLLFRNRKPRNTFIGQLDKCSTKPCNKWYILHSYCLSVGHGTIFFWSCSDHFSFNSTLQTNSIKSRMVKLYNASPDSLKESSSHLATVQHHHTF